MKAGVLVAVAALGACSSDDVTPYSITITGDEHLVYLAAQDGDGAWQRLNLDAAGQATFEVTHGYHGVAWACAFGSTKPNALTVRYDAGAEAGPQRPCGAVVPTATLSGAINPSEAELWIGPYVGLIHQPGTYAEALPLGRYDVVATAGNRLAIYRDQQLDADRTLDLDVAATGVDLTSVTPTVTGAGADPVSLYAEILTVNQTYVRHPDASPAALIVPAARRVVGDRVVIGAERGTAQVGAAIQREIVGDALPALEFAPLPALEVDRAGVRFGAGWEFTAVAYRASAVPGLRARATITAAWADASGATAQPLLDAAALPGWDPAWPTIAPATAIAIDTWAGIGDLSGDYQTAWASVDATW